MIDKTKENLKKLALLIHKTDLLLESIRFLGYTREVRMSGNSGAIHAPRSAIGKKAFVVVLPKDIESIGELRDFGERGKVRKELEDGEESNDK